MKTAFGLFVEHRRQFYFRAQEVWSQVMSSPLQKACSEGSLHTASSTCNAKSCTKNSGWTAKDKKMCILCMILHIYCIYSLHIYWSYFWIIRHINHLFSVNKLLTVLPPRLVRFLNSSLISPRERTMRTTWDNNSCELWLWSDFWW